MPEKYSIFHEIGIKLSLLLTIEPVSISFRHIQKSTLCVYANTLYGYFTNCTIYIRTVENNRVVLKKKSTQESEEYGRNFSQLHWKIIFSRIQMKNYSMKNAWNSVNFRAKQEQKLKEIAPLTNFHKKGTVFRKSNIKFIDDF